ncbi:flavin reductase family protein [Candidatus Micrarchaeota archaeon]|nr:flavin reductase family protein [Candidatus Micrarchaeota archaeon]
MISSGEHHLMYPIHTVLVTSTDGKEKNNIIAVDWAMPVSFEPFLVVIAVGRCRYSHKLISKTKQYVLCIPPYELKEAVVYCGTHHGDEVDKFKETGLTQLKAEKVKAPLIKECIACVECKVVKAVDAGDHTLFVGEVVRVVIFPENKNKTKIMNRGAMDFKEVT